jgi:hypothetical protein
MAEKIHKYKEFNTDPWHPGQTQILVENVNFNKNFKK